MSLEEIRGSPKRLKCSPRAPWRTQKIGDGRKIIRRLHSSAGLRAWTGAPASEETKKKHVGAELVRLARLIRTFLQEIRE
jgi:hypothetical protein